MARHKWTKIKEKEYICKKCDCKKYVYPFNHSMYIHMYAITFKAPECMTIKKPERKTDGKKEI